MARPPRSNYRLRLDLRFTFSYRDVEQLLREARPRYLVRNGVTLGPEVRRTDGMAHSPLRSQKFAYWHKTDILLLINASVAGKLASERMNATSVTGVAKGI